MGEYLLDETKEGALIFTINREDKRNAINYEVMEGLKAALEEAAGNNQIKMLIITAAGDKAFCSGGDLDAFHGLKSEEQAYSMLRKMGDILYQLAVLPKLTVALINGIAAGGGCEIAAACDFRIARKGVKMGFIQGKLSITTGWGGGSLLMERIRCTDALYLLGTAGLYESERMHQLGFVNHLLDKTDKESALQVMEGFLARDVHVLSAYKQMMKEKWEAGQLPGRIEKEIRKCAELWAKDEHHTAVENFLSNRKK
ncbi:enoyl-CoA hydratase/isomerase family protein [Bacillus salacetis]|uniref:Enoyl-CoA hydratase/isomerase family protein n=1 Tax=Bacillus salacetis TaxID=2315464 RepID=A0A3A1R2M5_9BACI|nr:enoyl-CoA hydratase/isomerase family protein [Bacillus salacetis]RIW36304.1 enoyl-CoA hydratase/isomerase family protein [Bacillus salacetis]